MLILGCRRDIFLLNGKFVGLGWGLRISDIEDSDLKAKRDDDIWRNVLCISSDPNNSVVIVGLKIVRHPLNFELSKDLRHRGVGKINDEERINIFESYQI